MTHPVYYQRHSLDDLTALQSEKEARSRAIEKKPPMAAISLGTDVDAPRGEKMETSGKRDYQNIRPGCPTASCGGC